MLSAAMPPSPPSLDTPFSAARRSFEQLLEGMGTGPLMRAAHGDVEQALWTQGAEVLRQVLQGHLDVRAAAEERPSLVRGADTELRPHVRHTDRKLETRFGTVVVHRMSLGNHGVSAIFPLDGELNLPPELYSHGVQLRVAEEVARGSFGEAGVAVARTTAAEVPKRQVEEIAERAAQDFDTFYEMRATRPEAEGDLIALSFDGKGIVMRNEDLRPATRKAATEQRHKLGKRLSKGEKRNRKRMAVVAAVYSIRVVPRVIEDIVQELYADDSERPPRPKPTNKQVWASIEKEPEEVIREAFDEADRRDPTHARSWVVLVDGNLTQIQVARAEARKRGIQVTLVLDIIHVLEYLWGAAWCFHREGDLQAEAWVSERLRRILEGRSSDVAAGIRRSATKRKLEPDARKKVDKCADYLIKYRTLLRYDTYLAAGMPIATGVIEGACRHLVKDRMDLTGARWTLAGAEAVLRLRALHANGDLDEYWRFHQAQELDRNHRSLYHPDSLPPSLKMPQSAASEKV